MVANMVYNNVFKKSTLISFYLLRKFSPGFCRPTARPARAGAPTECALRGSATAGRDLPRAQGNDTLRMRAELFARITVDFFCPDFG